MTGAVLIRDQFGNGVGDISIVICRSDGGEVVAQCDILPYCFSKLIVFQVGRTDVERK